MIGVPSLFNALLFTAFYYYAFRSMNRRLTRIEEKLTHIEDLIARLGQRITRIEIKLGIQP
jgi:tetrahydromethanopterin S-methyltransferase subunit G